MGNELPNVKIKQIPQMKCPNCQGSLFDKTFLVGFQSKMDPDNKTGIDRNIGFDVFICRKCGVELGKKE